MARTSSALTYIHAGRHLPGISDSKTHRTTSLPVHFDMVTFLRVRRPVAPMQGLLHVVMPGSPTKRTRWPRAMPSSAGVGHTSGLEVTLLASWSFLMRNPVLCGRHP
jgi:hypothetical protein